MGGSQEWGGKGGCLCVYRLFSHGLLPSCEDSHFHTNVVISPCSPNSKTPHSACAMWYVKHRGRRSLLTTLSHKLPLIRIPWNQFLQFSVNPAHIQRVGLEIDGRTQCFQMICSPGHPTGIIHIFSYTQMNLNPIWAQCWACIINTSIL